MDAEGDSNNLLGDRDLTGDVSRRRVYDVGLRRFSLAAGLPYEPDIRTASKCPWSKEYASGNIMPLHGGQ